jgi:hypothetical protein
VDAAAKVLGAVVAMIACMPLLHAKRCQAHAWLAAATAKSHSTSKTPLLLLHKETGPAKAAVSYQRPPLWVAATAHALPILLLLLLHY